MLHKFVSKLFRVASTQFSNWTHQKRHSNQDSLSLRQHVPFQSPTEPSSFKDALAAARQYFSQFEENREAFFSAIGTDEFHEAFMTILNSLSEEDRQQLYEKATTENKRFEDGLAQGDDMITALAAYLFEDMPQLGYFYTHLS